MLEEGEYSGRGADMWSLGVILFTMLSGRYPFYATSPSTLFAMIKSGNYSAPDDLSFLARSLIASLLQVDPSMRLSTTAVLEHPWFNSDSEHGHFSLHTVPKAFEDSADDFWILVYMLSTLYHCYLSCSSPVTHCAKCVLMCYAVSRMFAKFDFLLKCSCWMVHKRVNHASHCTRKEQQQYHRGLHEWCRCVCVCMHMSHSTAQRSAWPLNFACMMFRWPMKSFDNCVMQHSLWISYDCHGNRIGHIVINFNLL